MTNVQKFLGIGIWDLFRSIRAIRNWSLIFFFWILLFSFPSLAFGAENPQSLQITIFATIGEPKLTLFGWTSPLSYVELRGQGVLEGVISRENGYFYFDRVFLPRANPNYPEICLSVIDRQSRLSAFPTCLPPLPSGPFEISVGPVLLPPTISLEKGEFLPGQQVVARGSTIPNSKVTIFLANNTPSPKSLAGFPLKGIGQAWAFGLPKYEIAADRSGNFEFNLPAQRPANWRVFASTEFLGSPSPKSTNLTFKVLSWWEWFWLTIKKLFLAILSFLKPNWWWLIIGGEILLILFLLRWRSGKNQQPTSRNNVNYHLT